MIAAPTAATPRPASRAAGLIVTLPMASWPEIRTPTTASPSISQVHAAATRWGRLRLPPVLLKTDTGRICVRSCGGAGTRSASDDPSGAIGRY